MDLFILLNAHLHFTMRQKISTHRRGSLEFGEKLQELRKSRGLTQQELAEALYVSRTAISKWESGVSQS